MNPVKILLWAWMWAGSDPSRGGWIQIGPAEGMSVDACHVAVHSLLSSHPEKTGPFVCSFSEPYWRPQAGEVR